MQALRQLNLRAARYPRHRVTLTLVHRLSSDLGHDQRGRRRARDLARQLYQRAYLARLHRSSVDIEQVLYTTPPKPADTGFSFLDFLDIFKGVAAFLPFGNIVTGAIAAFDSVEVVADALNGDPKDAILNAKECVVAAGPDSSSADVAPASRRTSPASFPGKKRL